MPNGNTHLAVGLVCGTVTSLALFDKKGRQPDLGMLALTALTGLGAGRLPDLLEPATHPNHRAFFHSALFGVLLFMVGKELWFSIKKQQGEQKKDAWEEVLPILLLVMVVAVLGHLFLDSFTKKSLPFV